MKLTYLLLSTIGLTTYAQTPTLLNDEIQKIPIGYEWIINPDMTDEFNGQSSLNTTKWHSRLPNWAGRTPAEFLPENIYVQNDEMLIRNTPHPAPHDGYTIASGGIESKSSQTYGYFEAKMKASRIRMSSTFWLNTNQIWDNPDVNSPDRPGCQGFGTEIDIIECMGGGSPDFAAVPWDVGMASNTHFKLKRIKDGNCSDLYLSRGNAGYVKELSPGTYENVADDYHTYAAWWVNSNLVHYYIDGEYRYSVAPRDDNYSTPFNVPMTVRMVTETYDWQVKSDGSPNPGYPDPTDTDPSAELNNESINTTHYDWVRSYSLQPISENLANNGDLETGTPTTLPWASFASTGSVSFSSDAGEKFTNDKGAKVKGNGGLEQIITVTPNTDYVYSVMVKTTLGSLRLGVKESTGNIGVATVVNTSITYENNNSSNPIIFKEYEIPFNSGPRTQVKFFVFATDGNEGIADNFSVLSQDKYLELRPDSILAINETIHNTKKEATVFANNSTINITSSSTIENAHIEIFSISGLLIYSEKNVEIDSKTITTNFSNSIYIIKITSKNNGTITKKIVL